MEDHILEEDFNGLRTAQPSLPAKWYYDPEHFEREMREIWRKNWVYLCRSEMLPEAGGFRTFKVGGQGIIVLRDTDDDLRGYFNTCRHRGSELCTAEAGTLDRRITCPYHQWTYALDGRLLATGPMRRVENFDRNEYSLLKIAIAEWGGCVFANLAGEEAVPFASVYGDELAYVASWPLEDLVLGHSYTKILACNWKIFWENFNECLHCPNIHPELCELVPIYGRAIMARRDDPDWQNHAAEHTPLQYGGLRDGAETWSMDGAAQDVFPGLNEEERAAGQRYTTLQPSAFVAAHVDYVRIVSMTPLSPETMELKAEWLFQPETLTRPDFDLSRIVDFAVLVMEQDGQACELNQRGLRADGFERGVLMQEEYEVFLFQDWVREALGEPRLSVPPASRSSRRLPARE